MRILQISYCSWHRWSKNKKGPCKPLIYKDLHSSRRERDSNPRKLALQRFSRPPQSTTLPSLPKIECKDMINSHNKKSKIGKFFTQFKKINISLYLCINRAL